MKIKSIAIIFMFLIFVILFNANSVEAASVSISDNQTVEAGTTITVEAGVNAGVWDLTLSGGGQSYRIFGNTSIADNAFASGSITFVANETTTVTLSGTIKDFYASDESKPETVNKTMTVTIKEKEQTPQEPEEPQTPQVPTTTQKSNNANVTMIETSPVDFSGFKANKTSGYEISVDNDIDKIYVNVKKEDSKASVSLLNKTNSDTGKSWVYIVEGNNEINVTVTAEDGKTSKTYTINVKRAEKTKEENKETEEIPKETEKIPEEISDPIEEVFGLSELTIEGIELKPKFQTDVYEYKINIEDIEQLSITTLATEANTSIEILGNEKFVEGENIVTIHVKGKDEEKNATYQIIVNKTLKMLKENLVNENEILGTINNEGEQKNNSNKILIIIAIIVILAIVIGMVIINSRKNRSFYELADDDDDISLEIQSENEMQKVNNANDEFFEEVRKSKGKRFK